MLCVRPGRRRDAHGIQPSVEQLVAVACDEADPEPLSGCARSLPGTGVEDTRDLHVGQSTIHGDMPIPRDPPPAPMRRPGTWGRSSLRRPPKRSTRAGRSEIARSKAWTVSPPFDPTMFARDPQSGHAQPSASLRVPRETLERARKCAVVLHRHQDPRLAVSDQARVAWDIGGDNRDSGRHRLEDTERHPLGRRWADEHVDPLQPGFGIGPKAVEGDSIGDSRLRRKSLEGSPSRDHHRQMREKRRCRFGRPPRRREVRPRGPLLRTRRPRKPTRRLSWGARSAGVNRGTPRGRRRSGRRQQAASVPGNAGAPRPARSPRARGSRAGGSRDQLSPRGHG